MDLTEEQEEAFNEFKIRTKDFDIPEHLQDDSEMVKWLIARKFNVNKAVQMLNKSLEWRKKWHIDTILDWEPPEVLMKYCPAGLSGYTKQGLPVWIINSGKVDIRGILQSVSKKDYLRYNVQILEYCSRVIGQNTKHTRMVPLFRQTLIIDLEDYNLDHATWKPGLDITRELTVLYEENYPEMLNKCCIINAPKVFTILFAAIKPVLDDATLKKANIFGNTGWKEILLEDIPADQLPVRYGGTMTDPDGDPMCPSKICYGGLVPTSYFLKKVDKTLPWPEGFESLLIPSRERKVIRVNIEETETILSWHIETDNADIGFGITWYEEDEERWMTEEERINSSLVPEQGNVVCHNVGNYGVVLNNEFSIFRSKTILIRITLNDSPYAIKL